MSSAANAAHVARKPLTAVVAALVMLLAGHPLVASDYYTWSAELVSVDEAAEAAILKAMVTTHADLGELPTLAEGERVTIIWSGRTRASGIRGITRGSGVEIDAFALPAQFVGSEMDGRYILFRLPVPRELLAEINRLGPGAWVTMTSPHPWRQLVMSARAYDPLWSPPEIVRGPQTFTATTTDMMPSGVALRMDVLEWSDEAARSAVVNALTREDEEVGSLARLPTIGYVWASGSGVGYAIKYASAVATPGGGERITLVTDRPLGGYGLEPWSAEGRPTEGMPSYSVVQLDLDGEGEGAGTLSIAADVVFRDDLISLADGAPRTLSGVRREPKPYWIQE